MTSAGASRAKAAGKGAYVVLGVLGLLLAMVAVYV